MGCGDFTTWMLITSLSLTLLKNLQVMLGTWGDNEYAKMIKFVYIVDMNLDRLTSNNCLYDTI